MSIFDKLAAGVTTTSAEETRALAAGLGAELPPDTTLALHGDLGVGKTTFTQGLAQAFGIHEAVTSPSFTIFNLHRGTRTLIHLDAYRLENGSQIDALMLEDFLTPPYCLVVEWPEKIAEWMPANALHLTLSIEGEGRHRIRLG